MISGLVLVLRWELCFRPGRGSPQLAAAEGTRRSRSFPLKEAPEKMTYRKYTVGLAVLIASGASIYLTSRYYRLKIAVKERVDRAKRFIFVLGLGGLAISGLYLFTRAKRALRVTSFE